MPQLKNSDVGFIHDGIRTKEIGVRKILGADVFSITTLLTKEFVILIIVANLIAIPLVWYFAEQ